MKNNDRYKNFGFIAISIFIIILLVVFSVIPITEKDKRVRTQKLITELNEKFEYKVVNDTTEALVYKIAGAMRQNKALTEVNGLKKYYDFIKVPIRVEYLNWGDHFTYNYFYDIEAEVKNKKWFKNNT